MTVTGQISKTTGISILVSLTPALRKSAAEVLARKEVDSASKEPAKGVPRAMARESLLENSRTESVGIL
jgi:hypothetical protein